MKLIIIIAAIVIVTVALAILLVLIAGSRLPKQHSVTRSALLRQSPDKVYALMRDFGSMPKWRDDVKAVTVTTTPDGRVRFREEAKHGTVNYELTEDLPGRRMVTRITDTDLGYAGQWTYVFVPEGANTRVTITEDGEISNLFFRVMSRYVFGQTSSIDAYLTSLGKHFGESVRPQ